MKTQYMPSAHFSVFLLMIICTLSAKAQQSERTSITKIMAKSLQYAEAIESKNKKAEFEI